MSAKSLVTTTRPAPLPLPGGELVGPYRLCFQIASGGMATVYLARADLPAGVHRFVALKRIHFHLMKDPAFVEMFKDEARIGAQVHHANVCSVFDFGVADGAYYLAMEYLAGESLSMVRRTMLKAPPDSNRLVALACRVIADAAEGIHAAHELCAPSGEKLNIVHRDISPDNIFVTHDGVVKIVDFGVARATRQKHKTRAGVLKGKYAYIQPEVLRGSKPDRGGDVWGLGVILWELLTLKRLFNRKTEVETLRAVLSTRIPPPSEIRAGLPAGLDEIVLRTLARDPAQRYQTARELGRALTRFLAEHRMSVGLAELSEWMEELFPGGRARKHQLLEIAERVEPPPVLETKPAEVEDERTLFIGTEPQKRKTLFDVLRAHPRSVAVGTLCVTALAGGAVGRTSVGEGQALAATVAPLAPPMALATAVPAAPAATIEVADTPAPPLATGSPGSVPIRLGTGPYVLEIAPSADTGSDGVVLRIKNGGSKARREIANSQAVILAPSATQTAPQPLEFGSESP